jgi:hypothetical protein
MAATAGETLHGGAGGTGFALLVGAGNSARRGARP